MNFLALNLANDVIKGKKSPEEARNAFARKAMMFMKGEKDPYTQKLMFTPNTGEAGFPDKTIIDKFKLLKTRSCPKG
ncbi:MAG: hypothetical protein ACLFQV_07695 [Vulcanimicrobiota bacterium]